MPITTTLRPVLADGWIPSWVSPAWLSRTAAQARTVRTAAGVMSEPLTIIAGPVAAVAHTTQEAQPIVAQLTAWYLLAMGEWPRLIAAQGYDAQAKAVLDADKRHHVTTGVIPEEAEDLLEAFTAYGTADEIGPQLNRWDDAADVVCVWLPPAVPWPILATIRAAAPLSPAATSGRPNRPDLAVPCPVEQTHLPAQLVHAILTHSPAAATVVSKLGGKDPCVGRRA